MEKYLSFTETAQLIAAVGPHRTVIVEGENGVGKSSIFHYLKKQPQFRDHIAVDPIDCTQLSDGSVWMPDIDREAGVSRELPNERFGVSHTNQKGVNGSRPVMLMLDEIGKAPRYIHNILAPIIYEQRLGAYHFPEGSLVFCATNLGIEGLADSIQAHLRNRLIFVKMRKPTKDEWLKWAMDNGVEAEIQAFVHNYPMVMDSFLDYEKGGKFESQQTNMSSHNGMIFNPRAVQTAYASPRSLHASSDVLRACSAAGVPLDVVQAALCGTIGVVAAENLMAFIRFGKDLCSYERIIQNPKTALLSDNAAAQLVQVFKFVSQVKSRDEAEKICVYVERMRAEMQSLFFTTIVSNTAAIGNFATLANFADMLKKHRVYLGA